MPAPMATDEEILLFHTPQYVEVVKSQSIGPGSASRWGLGTLDNPVFSSMHQAAALRVGATLDAVRRVAGGSAEHAVNLAGGLHHALPDRASGFCIYNDIGVAIRWLREELGWRVAYVDMDAHHGDGVQWGFYDDPHVLTISIHETGESLFPGTGGVDEIGEGEARGTSINIPLLPYTHASSWLECFEMVVPAALRAFRPDIIISQHGCDAHRLDPLTHLAVSTQSLESATRLLHELAHELCQGRWVALGGGGYSIWNVVPRAWAAVWAVVSGQDVPSTVPEAWRSAWQPQAPVELPVHWHDLLEEAPPKDGEEIEAQWRAGENRRVAENAIQTALRLLG